MNDVNGLAGQLRAARVAAIRVSLLCAFVLLGWSPVLAQLSPSDIEEIQRQVNLGQVTGRDPADQLDDSRELTDQERELLNARERRQDLLESPLGALTEEELELRRELSRRDLRFIREPSPIEEEYEERLGVELEQFGYDLFRSTGEGAAPVTGQVSDSYIVGVGDELLVTFSGAENDTQTARVARDGRLIVSPLPPIDAVGRSLGDVRRQIQALTRQNLLGTDAYVSLGGIRSISVFVGGEVERPGQYQTTSMAGLIDVLARAGGINRTGTLRGVLVYRGGRTFSVDLYGLLGIGTPPAFGLEDGDRVIVPVIGPTAAVAGSVARPAIYELAATTTVDELLSYAGGAVPPRGYDTSISRIGDDGQEIFIDPVGPGTTIIAGDALFVVAGSAGGTLNRVVLRGFVGNAGPRSLGRAATVRDLVGPLTALQEGTYLPMAALRRRSEVTGLQELVAVDLLSALNGTSPFALQPGDELFVFSEDDIAFLNSALVRDILAGGEAEECDALRSLQYVVETTQSPRFNAVLRSDFFRTAGRDRRRIATGRLLSETTDRLDEEIGRTYVEEDEEVEIECQEIFEDYPELLPFVLERAVSVGGAVRQPGGYPVARTEDLATMISVAGGVLGMADEAVIDIVSGDATARYALPGPEERAGLANVILTPGDEVRITAPFDGSEIGTVLLTGEFRSPGLYAIRPGERLSDLIVRAGGYTDQAYPYGGVYTRESVKEAALDARQESIRQLRLSILNMAARSEVETEGVGSATELLTAIRTAPVSGRMVVEADLSALLLRPDLDPLIESGDAFYVPNVPTNVYVFGSVLNPGAVQFQSDKNAGEYLADAGGTALNADDSNIFIVFPNGNAQPVRSSYWRRSDFAIPPGSTIIVPTDLTPGISLEVASSVAGVIGGIAQSIAALVILSNSN